MTKLWRTPVLIFAVAGLVSFLAFRAQDSSPAPAPHLEEDEALTLGFTFDPLQKLAELHETMLSEGLPLVRVDIEGVDTESKPATVMLRVSEVLWSPADGTTPRSGTHEVTLRDGAQADLTALSAAAERASALAVLDNRGSLVAFAALDAGDSAFYVSKGQPTGPLFLAHAAEAVYSVQYDPVPKATACEASSARDEYANPVDALASYFEILGDRSAGERVSALADLDDTVEDLVLANSELVDPVTGRVLAPARNDLASQLRQGVAAEDILIRPAIPIGVRVGDALDDNALDGQVAVFVAEPTGIVLGWTLMNPAYEVMDDGSREAITERVVELAPPPRGDDLAVYLRSVEEVGFDCPATAGEQPVMTVHHDDYAGIRRATIDLSAFTYEDATDL